ncbi:MAG: DUF892 family protein [Tunicatimonas sp.]|uniref:DUF892 family protein n=1 Tax=Tunicatimonas sp. TaxID=1940096 RepID=UPI003C718E55
MKYTELSQQNLFVCYLQELYDTKTQQIAYYTYQALHNHFGQLSSFLAKQQESTAKQRDALEILANSLSIYLSEEAYSPVRNLFRDAKEAYHSTHGNNNLETANSAIAHLLQEVKYHEMVVGQEALTLACNQQEIKVASVLSKILDKDEQAYLQLRNFTMRSRKQSSSYEYER